MLVDRESAGRAGWTLAAAAAIWPSLYGGLAWAVKSPLERALAASWCGAGPHGSDSLFHTAMLGHCATCWTGAALLLAASLLAFAAANARQDRRGSRRASTNAIA